MAITLPAVYARNDEARAMVAGFAAFRAALAAHAEGPLSYLRDEPDGQVLTEALGGDRDDA